MATTVASNTFELSIEKDFDTNCQRILWAFYDKDHRVHQSQHLLYPREIAWEGRCLDAEMEKAIVYTFYQLLDYLDRQSIDYSHATL